MAHLNWVTGESLIKGLFTKVWAEYGKPQGGAGSSASGGITGGSSNRIYRESPVGLPIRSCGLQRRGS